MLKKCSTRPMADQGGILPDPASSGRPEFGDGRGCQAADLLLARF